MWKTANGGASRFVTESKGDSSRYVVPLFLLRLLLPVNTHAAKPLKTAVSGIFFFNSLLAHLYI